jgi:exodeoxyribonuclease-3
MKIFSWNINGIRAIIKKDFVAIIKKEKPDVICLQETKAFEDQIPKQLFDLGYDIVWHSGERAGYAGTAILTKVPALQSLNSFDKYPKFHEDGRVTEVQFKDFTLLNIYFPNGGARADGTPMLPYKMEFYDELTDYIKKKRRKQKNILIVGDYNIVHSDIDIARPDANRDTIGNTEPERQKMYEFMKKAKMVDTFRHQNPDKADEYTWWSYRAIGTRKRNVGWRIDYAMCTEEMLPIIKKTTHKQKIMGSDHCPVVTELKK